MLDLRAAASEMESERSASADVFFVVSSGSTRFCSEGETSKEIKEARGGAEEMASGSRTRTMTVATSPPASHPDWVSTGTQFLNPVRSHTLFGGNTPSDVRGVISVDTIMLLLSGSFAPVLEFPFPFEVPGTDENRSVVGEMDSSSSSDVPSESVQSLSPPKLADIRALVPRHFLRGPFRPTNNDEMGNPFN